ncbi:MAG: hypothetical protein VX915_04590 [Pseudomonadota bacterium]|nr:hypothetical protein [Pseudomonadota bacterium]
MMPTTYRTGKNVLCIELIQQHSGDMISTQTEASQRVQIDLTLRFRDNGG